MEEEEGDADKGLRGRMGTWDELGTGRPQFPCPIRIRLGSTLLVEPQFRTPSVISYGFGN